jgi:hypothetical protein
MSRRGAAPRALFRSTTGGGPLSAHDARVIENFRSFLAGEKCVCGRHGTHEVSDGMLLCSGCVVANVPPLPYAFSALTFPGHDEPWVERC